MAVPKTTIWPLEPHTQTKHLILRGYLAAWLPIMSRYNGRVVFIDAFAGPGCYSKGEDGSPLIALRALLDHSALGTGCEFKFFFIEAEKDRAESLRAQIDRLQSERPFPKQLEYEVAHGTFEERVGELLASLGGGKLAPTLAFIDPFGFEGLPLSLIAEIAKSPKCECFITFMYESVNRFLSHPNDKIQDHFEALFGTSEARAIATLSDPEERFKQIITLYESQLKKMAGFSFVRFFTMINEGNRVEYVLFFGTSNEVGLSRMKSAMWKADPGDGCRFSDRTVSDQEVLLGPEPNFALLEKLLRARFIDKGFVDIADIGRFVLVETGFLDTHIKQKTLAPMERATPPRIEAQRGPGKKKCTYPDGTKIRFL